MTDHFLQKGTSMDEIELLKKLKKSSKEINILIVLFSLLIAMISFIVFPSKTSFFTSICILILGLIMGSINFIAYLIICFKYKLVSSKIESPKIYKEYLRDVCNL